MSECRHLRHLRTCLASKSNRMNPMNNLKNIHNLKKVNASRVRATASGWSAPSDDPEANERKHWSQFARYDYPIARSGQKLLGLVSNQRRAFKLNRSSLPTISIGLVDSDYNQYICSSPDSPRTESKRAYSTLTMGLVSGKCERKSQFQCACCSNALSNCSCNCEKSTRCLCAGPRHFHRIGVTHHSRWFSTSTKMNSKDLTGMDLLREPNVNKVCTLQLPLSVPIDITIDATTKLIVSFS